MHATALFASSPDPGLGVLDPNAEVRAFAGFDTRASRPARNMLISPLMISVVLAYLFTRKPGVWQDIRFSRWRCAAHRRSTKLETPVGRLALASSIALTSGPLVIDVDGDSLFVHWLEVKTRIRTKQPASSQARPKTI